jgi:hypothetical protein
MCVFLSVLDATDVRHRQPPVWQQPRHDQRDPACDAYTKQRKELRELRAQSAATCGILIVERFNGSRRAREETARLAWVCSLFLR